MTRVRLLSLCLPLLACAPATGTGTAPDTGQATSTPDAPALRIPAGGEYVALSDPSYGYLGLAAGAPSQGERMPDFELPNHRGGTTRLSEALAQGPVVLMIYRGFW